MMTTDDNEKQGLKRPNADLRKQRPKLVGHPIVTETQSTAVPIDSDSETPAAEDQWPLSARLSRCAFLQQSRFLQGACREDVQIVERTLVVKEAWPELHRAREYRREVLLEVVNRLVEQKKGYADLRRRIVQDDDFVKVIGKWVIVRLPHHRAIKCSAASNNIALFQLGAGSQCKDRVEALMDSDIHVYPGEWAPIWMTKGSGAKIRIYLNPGLINTIKDAFFFLIPTAFGIKFKDDYTSTYPTRTEPALPISLVALGATAFFPAMHVWRTGKKPAGRGGRFDGEIFRNAYNRHLYEKIVSSGAPSNASTNIKGNALVVLDLNRLN
ncbi:hypothetical protein D9613_012379 [Agrocybe pediades]|uniref:DUF6532 domain-containing protein n=1 Tax=Agrocybe pediades TaxID=84607 RepID=A0A8H4VQ06_9AGAR|nr:hypothetical protein D9613_012379 [Agrocybe pediades]